MTVKKALDGRVYEMTATLKGIRPPIWRRVQVPGSRSRDDFEKLPAG